MVQEGSRSMEEPLLVLNHPKDETFEMKHDKPFLLSMANRGKDTNGSQFFLTTKPAPHLDGLHVVFGHVIDGEEFVAKLENQRTDVKNRPLVDIIITNCGELVLKVRAKEPKKKKKKEISSSSDTESSDSSISESSELTPSSEVETESTDSEDERKKKKKKKKKMRMKIRKKRQREKRKLKKKLKQEQETTEGKPFQCEVAPNVTINPEEIPDIPAHNFLTRVPIEKKEEPASTPAPPTTSGQYRPPGSRSGRKVKGRGNIRYRTPTRSHSRSPTPQYWKTEANREIERQRGWDIDATRRYITTGKTAEDDKWEKGTALKEEMWRRNRDRRYDESSPEESRSWRHERKENRRDHYKDEDDYHDYHERPDDDQKRRKKDKDKSKGRKSGKKRKHKSREKSDSMGDKSREENGNRQEDRRHDVDSPPPTHWKRGMKPWKGTENPGRDGNELYKDIAPPSKKSRQSEDIFAERSRSPSRERGQDRSRSASSEGLSPRSLSATKKRILEKMKTFEERKKADRANWKPPEEDENIQITLIKSPTWAEDARTEEEPGRTGIGRVVSYQERTQTTKQREGASHQMSNDYKQKIPDTPASPPPEAQKIPDTPASPDKIASTPASPTSESDGVFDKIELVVPTKKAIPIVIVPSRWERDDEVSPEEETKEEPRKEISKFIPLKEAEPGPAVPHSSAATMVSSTAPTVPTPVISTNQSVLPRTVTIASQPNATVMVPDSSKPKVDPPKKAVLSKFSLGSEISNQAKKRERKLRKRSWSRSQSKSSKRYSVSSSRSRSRSPGPHRRDERRDYRPKLYRDGHRSRSPRSRSRSYSRSRSRSHHRGRSRSHHREPYRSPRHSRSYHYSRSRSRSYRSRSRGSYSSRGSSSRSRSYTRSRSRSHSRS